MSQALRAAVLVGLAVLLVPPVVAANPYRAELGARAAELGRRGRTPGGVLPLLGLMSLWDRVAPEEVERVIELGRAAGNHPLVRGQALLLAGDAARRRGQTDRARVLRAEAGLLEDWLLCGPFDSPGRRGHTEVFPVEKELGAWPDLTRSYAGKGQQVRWRSVSAFLAQPQLPLGSFVDPAREVTVYVQAFVSSEREQAAALRLGSGGAYKVFLNGAEVASREVYRVPRPDQEAIGLWLQRGGNRLVIKETVEDGRLELFVRLTRPDGAPLPGIKSVGTGSGALLAASRRQPPRPLSLVSYLREQAKGKPTPAQLRDLALLHARLSPDDTADHAAERAAERWAEAARSAQSQLALARTASDRNRQRRALEQALALEPDNPWALHRLAVLRHTEARTLEAVKLWRRLLDRHGGFLPARLQLIETLRGSGLEHLAARELDGLVKAHPRSIVVLRARAELAQAQHRPEIAEPLLQRILAADREDLAAMQALGELAIDRGDLQRALAQSEAALRVAPHLVHLHLNRAKRLAGLGRFDEAIAGCERAILVDPHAARALEEMGHQLLRAGRRDAAREAWRRALVIRPQNAELRAYLSFVDPARPRGRAEQHRVDPVPLVTAARGRPKADEPATVLLDLTAVEVHPSGLSRTLHQRLVRLDSTAGIKELSSHVIQFSPDRQQVEVRAARVHRTSGGDEAAIQTETALNEPWARLWYDTRGRVLRFAGLKPGDVVEIEYLVEDVASDNLFADYFGDVTSLQEPLRIERFEYILLTPEKRSIYVRQPKTPGVAHTRRVRDGWREDRWVARDLARIAPEPRMPGWSEVADYIHVSTYQRWSEVARWYWGLVKEQLRARPIIRETARRLAASARTDLEKIRAIQAFVARSTRYVGLEFGIHGYKPYPVDQVLSRKFGDCKDKASLLVALLREVGIEARLVVLRTRSRGDLDDWPASLAAFNHAIAYLPKQDLYVDGTAEFSGSGDLPWQDQGVIALHIDGGAGELRRTPVLPAESNRTVRRARWTVETSGALRIDEELQLHGEPAAHWRARYQVADQRREEYEKSWNSQVGGAKVLSVEMLDLDQLTRPVRVSASLQAQGLAQREGRRLSVRVGAETASAIAGLSSLSSRRYPLVLEYPWRLRHELRVVPPAGWRFGLQPSDASVKWKHGELTRRVRRDGDALEVHCDLLLGATRVSPSEYKELRENLLRIERLLSERAVLVEGGGR